jgi:hypothetical protein
MRRLFHPEAMKHKRHVPALLHHLEALLTLAGRRPLRCATGAATPSSQERRRQQRLLLAQRLLDPLPTALLPADRQAERFWTGLRWGGLGAAIAWLAHR